MYAAVTLVYFIIAIVVYGMLDIRFGETKNDMQLVVAGMVWPVTILLGVVFLVIWISEETRSAYHEVKYMNSNKSDLCKYEHHDLCTVNTCRCECHYKGTFRVY